MNQGVPSAGDRTFRCALALEPGRKDGLQLLYAGRLGAGRFEEASTFARRALAIDPQSADDWCNLGQILVQAGRRTEAERCFAAALVLDPQFGEVFHKLGVNLHALGRFQEAVSSYDRALALTPGNPELPMLQLSALLTLGPERGNARRFERLAAGRETSAEALLIRGCALDALRRQAGALVAFAKSLVLDPGNTDAWFNRGTALFKSGRAEEAVVSGRRSIAIKPAFAIAHTSLIFWADFLPELDFAAQQAERRKWAEIQRRNVPLPPRHANTRDPERPLRIGYVSSDFVAHSAAAIFGAIFHRHDRTRFELFLYSGVVHEDSTTQALRALSAGWRSTLAHSPDSLARQIRSDRIDILVDLSGHTGGNHLLTFLRKPAPVQVTAWGYSTGTGLSEIDYFFTDAVMVPEEERRFFAETVYDLPSVLTVPAPDDIPDVSPLPAETAGHVVFGCFNRASKIGPAAVGAWARILTRAPGARLFLKDRAFDQDDACRSFRNAFAARGVDPDRLEFEGTTSRTAHMIAHRRIDIALDPFPANGGVTTCEALMMGVPAVALVGQSAGGRLAASVMTAIGLPDWIGPDVDGYVEIAVAWSCRIGALSELRRMLRRRYLASPLGDADAYTRAVEAAYRDMWRRWCKKGLPS